MAILTSGSAREGATDALLSTIYLWGAHLSQEECEPQLVGTALRSVSGALGEYSGGISIFHLIQAEILLSNYLFLNSRILEGRYHMTKALSLATGARLHTIRSTETSSISRSSLAPPALAAIDEAEGIHAFWSVVILNNCWTSADRSPSNLVYTDEPGLRIDVPWPENMDVYIRNGIPPNLGGSYTVQRFLAGIDDGPHSLTALHAKASILLDRSTHIGSAHWNYTRSRSPEAQKSNIQFLSLGSSIQRLAQQIAHLNSQCESNSRPNPKLGTISMLLDAASIRLHENFANQQIQSRELVTSSARNIVRVVGTLASARRERSTNSVVIDPIIAPLAMLALQSLVEERRRASPGSSSSSHAFNESEVSRDEMQKLMNAMCILSSCCPLMKSRAAEVHRILATLGIS
ncbi:hypothetical protein PQX77_021094 [Marasmius sp. AFHP31]|nr:hypothetical protein PQX77_021094 [Marasmius sp. AFHP31]